MFSLNVKWYLHKASTGDSLVFIYFVLNNVRQCSGSSVQDANIIVTSSFVKHRLFVKRRHADDVWHTLRVVGNKNV